MTLPRGACPLALTLLLACGGGAPHGDDGAGTSPDAPVADAPPPPPTRLTVFDEVVFYDGYAALVDAPVPAGTLRLRNDLITRRLTDADLDALQQTLRAEVVIGALCDNYDRIGSVALALVPRGATTYQPDQATRIELGRFITPFMNKNRQPDQVPYRFELSDLIPVLGDATLRARFDLWLELEVFGVPYAANQQVAGCAGRNDVFRGSVTLVSEAGAPGAGLDQLVPLAYRVAFNNYQEGASDQLGTTRKTLRFTVDAAASAARLVLITSNHGAGSGGEEYERRDHHVTFDGRPVLTYKPGRPSCEPFRMYNTQGNGIYGASPRTDAQWQSFSNWCPGDVIDTRVIDLGALDAGPHTFVIDVPAAQFAGADGNFPLSLYLQSRR